ncbi:MAG: arginase [Planctomycetes bacterium]|nr:arginase [Planctomycetota bacterium]
MSRRVGFLGVPMDLGGGLRGVDMGPSAIRIAGLGRRIQALGLEFDDLGNVPVLRSDAKEPKNSSAKYLDSISNCCRRLRGRVERLLEEGAFPLVVGGDHSIACGTVAGISSFYHRKKKKIGLIWFDAHADMNTPESSPTGNVHGMPLASVMGFGPDALTKLGERFPMVEPEKAVLIGIRDVDPGERELAKECGIKVYSMRELDILGMDRVMKEAIGIVTHGTAGFHLSFDMDGLDPYEAPGVGTPVPGGVTQREAHLMLEHAAESGKLLGLEFTEINPILDERNRTAEMAVTLVLSGLGKRIV